MAMFMIMLLKIHPTKIETVYYDCDKFGIINYGISIKLKKRVKCWSICWLIGLLLKICWCM